MPSASTLAGRGLSSFAGWGPRFYCHDQRSTSSFYAQDDQLVSLPPAVIKPLVLHS